MPAAVPKFLWEIRRARYSREQKKHRADQRFRNRTASRLDDQEYFTLEWKDSADVLHLDPISVSARLNTFWQWVRDESAGAGLRAKVAFCNQF